MRHRVISPITHLGRSYAKGELIELQPFEAYQLIAAKVVELVPEPPPAPELPITRAELATKFVQVATPAIRKG